MTHYITVVKENVELDFEEAIIKFMSSRTWTKNHVTSDRSSFCHEELDYEVYNYAHSCRESCSKRIREIKEELPKDSLRYYLSNNNIKFSESERKIVHENLKLLLRDIDFEVTSRGITFTKLMSTYLVSVILLILDDYSQLVNQDKFYVSDLIKEILTSTRNRWNGILNQKLFTAFYVYMVRFLLDRTPLFNSNEVSSGPGVGMQDLLMMKHNKELLDYYKKFWFSDRYLKLNRQVVSNYFTYYQSTNTFIKFHDDMVEKLEKILSGDNKIVLKEIRSNDSGLYQALTDRR